MSQTLTLSVLDELWQDDSEFHGALYCPNCGTAVCSLSWSGELTGFEAVCDECEGVLFSFSTIAASDSYYQENGDPPTGEMKAYVTDYWDEQLSGGVMGESVARYETNGVIEEGEHAGKPSVEPVTEEVDITDQRASSYEMCAEKFGWTWSWEGRADHD